MPGVLFPQLGFATAEGTILQWLCEVGGNVEAGVPLVEIASEKAVNVVVAPTGGQLLAVYAPPGAIVAEGETLGWIGQPGEQPPEVQCRWLGWEPDIADAPEDLLQRLGAKAAESDPGATTGWLGFIFEVLDGGEVTGIGAPILKSC